MPKSLLKLPQNGFTLIELLVVIAIIGVLTSLLLANMVGIRQRGSDTKIKNDLRQFKTAMRLYYNDNQAYPPETGENCEDLASVNGDGDFISGSGDIYMRDIPTSSETSCTYWEQDGGESFLLRVTLDNTGDPDTRESAERCGQDPDAAEDNGYYYECTD